jgi:DNA polymerase III, delta subunit
MDKLILHENTARQVDDLVKNQTHAIAVVGSDGSGKLSLAKNIAQRMLEEDDLSSYPYILVLSPEKDAPLGIDDVRRIQNHLTLKVLSDKPINRIVILEKAHKLRLEAQNALLKTLEEPPVGTVIILTADNLQSLLPTIRSRLHIINVVKPEKESLRQYFGSVSDTDFNRMYALSGGLPGLMSAIISEDEHPLSGAARIAREIVSKTAYERMLMIDSLSKDKQFLSGIFSVLQQMADISLALPGNKSELKWKNILTESTEAIEALKSNAQAKLVLIKFMISI